MSNKKMTAVEWLEDNMPNISEYIPLGVTYEFTAKFQKAKEMEKEQMGLCFLAGDDSELQDVTFEQYYRETYEL